MRVVVVTPAEPAVLWEEAKAHLRLDSDDEQGYVENLIAGAQAWIQSWLGRSIGVQTLQVFYNSFEYPFLPLPNRPILEVESIEYEDTNGVFQTILPVEYELRGDSVGMKFGKAWPDARFHMFNRGETVRIRYTAGYEIPPQPIKQAILLLVGQWYSYRSNVAEDGAPSELPMAVEALLSPFRVWA